jgi:uncharacterized alkaline shock family protein YloU
MTAGRTTIASPVVEKIAALAAAGTPGVLRLEPGVGALATALRHRLQAHLPGSGQDGAPSAAGVRATVTGDQAAIEVALTVELGQPVAAIAARAQRSIARAVTELTGLAPASIAVTVVDVAPLPERQPRERPE